jgi:hypothetical protein
MKDATHELLRQRENEARESLGRGKASQALTSVSNNPGLKYETWHVQTEGAVATVPHTRMRGPSIDSVNAAMPRPQCEAAPVPLVVPINQPEREILRKPVGRTLRYPHEHVSKTTGQAARWPCDVQVST